jgi:hypothetical protein
VKPTPHTGFLTGPTETGFQRNAFIDHRHIDLLSKLNACPLKFEGEAGLVPPIPAIPALPLPWLFSV